MESDTVKLLNQKILCSWIIQNLNVMLTCKYDAKGQLAAFLAKIGNVYLITSRCAVSLITHLPLSTLHPPADSRSFCRGSVPVRLYTALHFRSWVKMFGILRVLSCWYLPSEKTTSEKDRRCIFQLINTE